MITRFFSRQAEFEVVAMQGAHCMEAAEIHAAAFSRAWSAEEIDSLLTQTNVRGFAALAHSPRGQVAGFALTRSAADEAEVLTVAVRRHLRNRGVGWRLLLAAIGQARLDGAEKLFLEVDETNASAIALYRRLGFVEVARRGAYYRDARGQPSAALVMRLDLI